MAKRVMSERFQEVAREVAELEAELTPMTIEEAWRRYPRKTRRLVTLLCAVGVDLDRKVLRRVGVNRRQAAREVWSQDVPSV
jgi:hypothetical protein